MNRNLIYTISVRGKNEKQPIDEFLKECYPSIPFHKIDSVFGFVEPTSLYSGRAFLKRQISDNDYEILKKNNIGLRLPFTNHYCSEEEYEKNKPLLKKYHRKGNSIITTNEDLAKWIRRDYPEYGIEASILKNIDTKEAIAGALKIYDTVVLPMNVNHKTNFLKEIEPKDRITLFGNAGCALSCPDRICYDYISKQNKILTRKSKYPRYWHFMIHIALKRNWCSNMLHPRKLHGVKDFNLDELSSLGFTRFKMLRENKERQSGY